MDFKKLTMNRGEVDIYIFYADVYFMQNFLMDYIALSSVNCFLKRGYKQRRMIAVAIVASVLSLFLHIYIVNPGIRTIILHFGLNMGMAVMAFGWSDKKTLLENWLVIYMTVLLLGGIMEWETTLGIDAAFFWGKAVIAAMLLSAATAYLSAKKEFMEKIFSVEIIQDGKCYALNGYWDSGNLLVDPYLGKPVQIIDEHTARQIFGEELPAMRLIPFRALGSEGGLLSVCNAQEMHIYQGKNKKVLCPVILGIADNELLRGKEYDVILQASVIEGS